MHLGHRLQHQASVLAAVERQPVLAQRLDVVALLAEGEAEVVMRQRAPRGDLRLGLRAQALLLAAALGIVALERQIGLRAPSGGLSATARLEAARASWWRPMSPSTNAIR